MGLEIIKVSAYSKKEAIEVAASQGFTIDNKFDVTGSYRNAIINADFNFEVFAETQINDKVKGLAGAGFIVAVKPGKAESKTRLYEVQIEKQQLEVYHVSYMLVSENKIIGLSDSKTEALQLAKELIPEVKAEIQVRKIKFPQSGRNAATVYYKPSLDVILGEYVLFGKTA